MITNKLIIRKASNILSKNEIADFSSIYFSPSEGVFAISIENNKWTRLFEDMYELLSYSLQKTNRKINSIKFMIFLYDQPNNRIVKYKGGWGLLKYHLDINRIRDKKEFVLENNGKVNFVLEGIVDIQDDYIIRKILSNMNVVYFSIGGKDVNKIERHDDWINCILDSGGIVLFFLGLGVEPACELVIMKKSEDILSLF